MIGLDGGDGGEAAGLSGQTEVPAAPGTSSPPSRPVDAGQITTAHQGPG